MIPGLPPRPRTVDLSGQPLTVEQMEHLGAQRTLVGVQLDDCPIGDEHVRAICGLDRLVNLSLCGTRVGDGALEHLARLPRLELLFLDRARIHGEGLRHLARSAKLETLWLCETDVDDATIGLAAAIPKLATLRIAKTRVTIDGLMTLAARQGLRVVADGQFSDPELAAFEAARRDRETAGRGKGKPPPADEAAAREVLVALFEALNGWERSLTAAQASGLPLWTADHQAACAAVFSRYCTERASRDVARRPFGEPPEHDREQVVDARAETKTKLWLYTKGHAGESRYLVVRGPDGWRIDRREWSSGRWQRRWL